MDFQQLQIFLKVASLKSFSRAAELLYISQPSVSAKVKALEEELGAPLFDRSRARELALTEAGITLMDYAQRMINLQEEALAELAPEKRPPSGTVQLGASTVPGIYLLPPVLAGLRQRFPGIAFHLSVLDTAAVLDKVLLYEFELGFVGSAAAEERLVFEPVAEDELVLIAPPGFFEGEAPGPPEPVTLELCLPHNLLIREEGSATRQLLESSLKTIGLGWRDFASVTHLNSLEGIKQAVRYGLGISLISRRAAEDYRLMGLIESRPVAGLELRRRLYLVRHRSRVLNRAACLSLEHFLNERGNDGAGLS